VRIIVAGAGVWGAYIAGHLIGQGHSVVVIEQDAAVAARTRAAGGPEVVHGDACEPAVLDRVGLAGTDTVVAATGDDEDNLVISFLAKRLGAVPRVVARVNNPKNTWLFTADWGVDTAVSAPALLTHLLDAGVGVADVVTMLSQGQPGGPIALVEMIVGDESPAVGRPPGDLVLPEGAVVVAVVQAGTVRPGGGPEPLKAGDEVLVVSTLTAEPAVRALLSGRAGT
jgi:trk system potassium uptake protein TrkA